MTLSLIRTILASAFSELIILVAVVSDLDQEIRLVAGIIGIILGVLTTWKVILDIKINRRKLAQKEEAIK